MAKQRHRHAGGVLILIAITAAVVRWSAPLAWGSPSTRCSPSKEAPAASQGDQPRRAVLALGSATVVGTGNVGGSLAEEVKLDRYGRAMLGDGNLATTTGLDYGNVPKFNGKPKVFVAGSSGQLGRRIITDLLRSGYLVRAGYRDEGKAREAALNLMADASLKTSKYNLTLVNDNLIYGERTEILKEQIGDATVVIDAAGAVKGFDFFRPALLLDPEEVGKTDLNGTKALVDAAVAQGVKKFIYVSAVLTNARALGRDVYESGAFRGWNEFGNVLDAKHSAEEYIQQSGLDYTILRPVPMTNDAIRDVGGMSFFKPDTVFLGSDEVGDKISRDDVSLAAADAIFNVKASNAVVELVGARGQKPIARDRWWELLNSSKAS